ncbi:hypothetical protein ACELLULO517_12155 [Acidisoma cellulosilytica]|uniref:Uncharacterized protein n=1 Tax=Acidisoma cellulosilyticum TaxID=2802395 RepID=A0A963Z1U8_9PROT|nr:DUF6635 family protein [Acidisoma cellulosilyticum]MCB8880989.1 hypothetical protein [Acidisoma cellulosilyticum]
MAEPETLDLTAARAAVEDGARRYFAARRAMVGPFVDRNFSFAGSLALHRAAVGWDIARAPLNLTLAMPQVAMQLGARAARRLHASRVERLLDRSILLRTDVAEEIEWRIMTVLLELPMSQKHRTSARNALTDAILESPVLDGTIESVLQEIGRHRADPHFAARLREAMTEYGITRGAAAEITTGLLNLGAGALAVQKLTPGAVTLGPALAGVISQHVAASSFPLGAWAASAWYVVFPIAPPAAGLVMTTTGGLMLASASLAAFAGIIADPVQRRLGLHQKRLTKMVDALERQFFDPTAAGFAVHDHYVARLLDLFDILGAAARFAGRG